MYGTWNRVRFSGRWCFIINGNTGRHQAHSSIWNCICRKFELLMDVFSAENDASDCYIICHQFRGYQGG